MIINSSLSRIMKTPLQQINIAITDLKNTKNNSFMATLDKDEELKYILHNRDRFITVINTLDQIVTKRAKNIKLLDIGTSPLTFILRKRYPNIDITTLDLSSNLSKRCKEANINFVQADLNHPDKLPTSKKYDVIIFLEVLEHLRSDHKKVMKWLSNILQDNGTCILQTPNKYSLKQLILTLIGGLTIWDRFSKRPKSPDEFSHFKEYSLSELKSLISSVHAFQIIKASYPLYYDTLNSSIVYRRFVSVAKIPLSVHYAIALLLPFLRRGMQVNFQKISNSKI